MTSRITVKIICPKCKQNISCFLYKSINATLNPELKARFLSNKLNIFECEKCKIEISIKSLPIMYHDMEKKFVVWYSPKGVIAETLREYKSRNHISKDNHIFNPLFVKTIEEARFMVFLCDKHGPPKSPESVKEYYKIISQAKENYLIK